MPPTDPGVLAELRSIESELDTRWGEKDIDPTLERVAALLDLLGNPQTAYPVVHITGTNGKTSTARMIDALFTSIGLRTGRFTSPHLQVVTERISLDGAPIDPARYVAAFRLLELDHVGDEEAEDLRAGGPRLVVRHVDDANAR